MKTNILIFTALFGGMLATPVIAADFDYSSLQGSWTVDGVAVPGDGVQALVTDDPQYMGATIAFAADGIEWTKGTETRPVDPEIDNCDAAPSVTPWMADPDALDETPIEGGFDVMCADDVWGTIVPVDDQTVELYWYDSGVLTLTRQ